jgi:hypothetical protein
MSQKNTGLSPSKKLAPTEKASNKNSLLVRSMVVWRSGVRVEAGVLRFKPNQIGTQILIKNKGNTRKKINKKKQNNHTE